MNNNCNFIEVNDENNIELKSKKRGDVPYYTLAQVASLLNEDEHQIRYYTNIFDGILKIEILDKQFVYNDNDVDKLEFLIKLKNRGMSIKQIIDYCDKLPLDKKETVLKESSTASIDDFMKVLIESQTKEFDKLQSNLSEQIESYMDMHFNLISEKIVAKQNKLITNLEKNLSKQSEMIYNLKKDFSEQNKIITGLEKGLSKQIKIITDLEKDLSEQNKTIFDLEKNLSEQNKMIVGLEKDLSEQNKIITGLEKDLSEHNKITTGLEKNLSEHNKMVMGLEKNLSEEIKNSLINNDKLHNFEKDNYKYITEYHDIIDEKGKLLKTDMMNRFESFEKELKNYQLEYNKNLITELRKIKDIIYKSYCIEHEVEENEERQSILKRLFTLK